MAGEDHYRTLGVDRHANADDLKRAYRRLARRFHPDLNPGNAHAESYFKRVSEAYETLSDPPSRSSYDRVQAATSFASQSAYGRAQGRSPEGHAARPSPSVSELFSEMFRRNEAKRPATPGTDITTTLDVSFEDAVRGATVRIQVRRDITCPGCEGRGGEPKGDRVRCATCGGTGRARRGALFRLDSRPCGACSGVGSREPRACASCAGRGLHTHDELLTLRIPAGVDAGSRVRVSARGNAGLGGGPAGDLYVVTRVGSHPFLTRDGDHLLLRAPITIPEAVLGTDLSVPTLDGTAVIKLPPGTQSGQRFRLRGKGIVSLKTGAPGDEIVEVQVVVPKLEDERSRELIRELQRLHPEDPRQDCFGARR